MKEVSSKEKLVVRQLGSVGCPARGFSYLLDAGFPDACTNASDQLDNSCII